MANNSRFTATAISAPGHGWTGTTIEAHVDYAFKRTPYYMDIVRSIIETNYRNTFNRVMEQFPVEYVNTNQPFRWKLRGVEDRRATLKGAYSDRGMSNSLANATTIGKNGQEIYLLFDKKIFFITHTIAGDHIDLYNWTVKDDPIKVRGGYLYRVALIGNDEDLYAPASEVAVGTQWKVLGAMTPSYGGTRGFDIGFSTPFDMEERLIPLRAERAFHGEMKDVVLEKPYWYEIDNGKGKKAKVWLDYEYMKLLEEFEYTKYLNLYYNKSTVDSKGRSLVKGEGEHSLYAGNGFRQQILPSNQINYDNLSYDQWITTLLDINEQDQRLGGNFIAMTGNRGLKAANEMIRGKVSDENFKWMGNNTGDAYKKSGKNDIIADFGNFIGMLDVHGISVKFVHNPMYDDPNINTIMHPDGGVAESYRMTIMNVGNKEQPNVKRIRQKDCDMVIGIELGLRTPPFPEAVIKNTAMGAAHIMSGNFDGWKYHLRDKEGIAIIDPTQIVEFKPNILDN